MNQGKAVLSAEGCKSAAGRPCFPYTAPKRKVDRCQSAGAGTVPTSLLHQSKTREEKRFEVVLGANKFGATPLMIAAWCNNTKEMRRLLKEECLYLDATDTIGRTALMIAAGEGRLEPVRLLVEWGADIFRTDDFGESALSMAAREGHVDTCKLLLEHEAELNEPDQFGQTPLIKASMNGHTEVVRLLLEMGAVHSLADASRETALMKAVKRGHPNVVRLLGDFGATALVKGKGTRSVVAQPTSPPITPLRRPRAESMTTNCLSDSNLCRSQTLLQSGRRSRAPSLNQPITSSHQQLLTSKWQLEAQLQRRQTQIATLKKINSQPNISNRSAPTDSDLVPPHIKKMPMDCDGAGEHTKPQPITNTPPCLRRNDVAKAIAELSLDDSDQSQGAENGAMSHVKHGCPPKPQEREELRESVIARVMKFERLQGGFTCPGSDGSEKATSASANGSKPDSDRFSPSAPVWLDEADALRQGAVPDEERAETRLSSAPRGSKLLKPAGLSRSRTAPTLANQFELTNNETAKESTPLKGYNDTDEELIRLREIITLAAANQEMVQKERAALVEEREALQRERAALQQEREQWQRAKQALDLVQQNYSAWAWLGLTGTDDTTHTLPMTYALPHAPPEYTETYMAPADQAQGKDNK